MNSFIKNDAKAIIERLNDKNDSFENTKILITGAFGFLGKQFLHYFAILAEDYNFNLEVHAYDNFILRKSKVVKYFSSKPYFHFKEVDIISEKDFPDVDYVIHLASIASPTFYRKYPIETLDANVTGYRNLLDYYKGKDIKSLIYFSTSEIYGDPPTSEIPTKESFRGLVSCNGPRACYDESKRMGETLSVLFNQIHSIPIKIVRPFNNYGPGLNINDKRVIPDFFNDILNKKSIKLYSAGKATRTFCYIEDAMYGYLLALLSNYDAEPFNIGTNQPEISIINLAKMCLEVSGSFDSNIVHEQSTDDMYNEDNPQRRCPDLTKSENLLGYRSLISLDEGLRRTYDYYLESFKDA